MKKITTILLCLTIGWVSAAASAQELYASESGTTVERAQADADSAHRRETELADRIAQQERTNATIRDQLRKVDSDPMGLMKDLVDVSDQAAVLRKKVADQRDRRDAAQDKLDAARERALAQYEQTQPMIDARRSVSDAGAELDRLSQPILEQLQQDDGYQEAQALVDAAAQAGEALQGFDNVDPKAQADADSAFDQANARVHELEDAAIDADPKTAEAHKNLKLAQDTLDSLRQENERKIASDPSVDAARFALDLEQRLLNDSSTDLGTAEKRLSALRQTTQPNAGPPTELSNALKEGEASLRDLNDQLDQARVARADADQRLRFAQDAVASGGRQPAFTPYPPSTDYLPPSFDPGYSDGYYDDGGYSYGYGGYGYSYPYYSYRSYLYDPYYCPPYYGGLGVGFFCGSSLYSRDHYRSYYRPHYYASDFRRFHDDSWRTRYDYWRRRDGDSHDRFRDGHFRDDRSIASRDGRTGFGSSRYDYARFNRSEVGRDRSARSNLDLARQASSGAERDYRYRTGVSTYNYPGSTMWRAREQESASLRAQQYERDARERRSTVEGNVPRGGISITPSRSSSISSRLSEERQRDVAAMRNERTSAEDARRREASDSSARRARADEASSADSTRARSEWRPRTANDESRGTRPNEDYGRSRAADSGSSRTPRAADVGRSRPAEVAPPRSSTPAPSRGRSDAGPSRSRSEAPAASPSRGSSRGGDTSPSAGSGRSGRSTVSPPPDFGSSRSAGRGGRSSSPPPSISSGRSSSRGDSGAPSGGSFRGSSRDSSPPPSVSSGRGSSGGGSARSGGSSSSSGGGGRRGR